MHGAAESLPRESVIPATDSQIEISGYLGRFTVKLNAGNGQFRQQLEADIVVDFNQPALLDTPMLPPGYIHIKESERNLTSLSARLLELTGEFEKPKYFQYNAAICAHGVNGKTVCTKCIDACPADAISSLVETIEVDPYRCQGGGSCATVCHAVAHSRHRDRIAALVSVAAFSDYHDIAQDALSSSWLFWLFQWPLSKTISNTYSPVESVDKVAPVPIFIMHSDEDGIIDYYHAEVLYEAALEPKQLMTLEGGHNATFNLDSNRQKLLDVLNAIIAN